MYKVDLPIDTKEAAKIQRRRRAEEERKLRIFNPKFRTRGVDLEAIKQQIEEKRAEQQRERDLHEAYKREACRQDALAQEIEQRLRLDRRRYIQELQSYRQNCQRFEDRREFDLNDPEYLKNSYPNRLHDEDPRLGPASVQKFEGEDRCYKERIRSQSHQNRKWLDYQMKEKQASIEQRTEAEEIHDRRIRETDLRNMHLYAAQMQARKAVQKATVNFNLVLAQETQDRRNLEKMADEEASIAHQLNEMQSELLTETTDATSVGRPHGVLRERFKGYSEERLAAIRDEQRKQALENCQKRQEEEEFNRAWDKQTVLEDTAKIIMEQNLMKERRCLQTQVKKTNMQLAREQKLRQEYYKSLNTNVPTEEFFAQFNTTTR